MSAITAFEYGAQGGNFSARAGWYYAHREQRQIERTVALSSASLPPQFTKMISRYDHDEQALFDAGIEYAVTQIRDLITGGRWNPFICNE
ncbi:MAG: hypothetical protein ACLRRT_04100 [Ruthenibacterium lactatiformans]